MSNEYYERKAEFKPFTTARSDDVRGEFDGIQSGFEKLPTPRQDGTKGFITPFTIVNPTEDNHPATKAMVAAENSKNTEQDGRLDQVENTLSGLGPVNGRYTTLRYVATAGQDTIVLPAQFGSLAYVFVNGARKFQTVNFVYDVNTKTLTFLSALALNDEVLVDVGVVPDAVLADLIAIQNDIASKHSDVQTWHSDVEQWQQEVASNTQTAVDAKDTAVAAKNEAVASRNVVVALFLGPKATAPTLDNDGNPLMEGACYYNTTDGKTYVWVDGGWEVTNLSSSTTVAKTGLTGAALIPKGATGERPDPASLPDNVMALRFNTDTNEWEGENAEGSYSGIGGGSVPPIDSVHSAGFIAKRNKYYGVALSAGEQIVIQVEAGLLAQSWMGAGDYNSTFDSNTFFVWELPAGEFFIQKNSEGEYSNLFLFDSRNGKCFIRKRADGYWEWSNFPYGTDAEYLQKRLDVSMQRAEFLHKTAPKVSASSVAGLNTRVFNTEVENTTEGVTLNPSTGEVTLSLVGAEYRMRLGWMVHRTNRNASYIVDEFDNIVKLLGSSYASDTYAASTDKWCEFNYVVTSPITLRLRHQVENAQTAGLGVSGTFGVDNVFATWIIERVK